MRNASYHYGKTVVKSKAFEQTRLRNAGVSVDVHTLGIQRNSMQVCPTRFSDTGRSLQDASTRALKGI